ncbi:MAG: transglutaminaseTgpA domain-containing protein [Candidatus Binatia bacterium]
MSFNLVFLASSYFLVFLGLTGLLFTGEISYYYLLLAGSSFVLAILGELRAGKGFLPGPWANIMTGGVFLLTLFSIFVLKAPPIHELVNFLLALQAVKLLASKKRRDWLQLYLLSFFSVVSASALTVEISFASIFVLYLFAAPWALVLFHLKEAMEAAGEDPERHSHLLSWSLFRGVGRISGFLFLLTLVFFITIPRISMGLLGDSWASGLAVTGFSDRLSLGDVAEIKKNNAVAMRVSVDRPDLLTRKTLYWRGVSLDRFDGRRWEKSKTRLTRMRRVGGSYLVGELADNPTLLIRQEIILEPTGSQVLFALGRPVKISGRLRHLFRDPLGNLRALYPFPFQISYTILSYLNENGQGKTNGGNFLQLPAIDPRIIHLSQRVTEGIDGEMKKARALERYLRENYRYTLKSLPTGEGDPLARFLFEVRQGDCEYFSSALTVMLRSLGIPARVVNGYLGGDWNPYGEYYLIRHSNAHSWVEAYLGDKGWVTLDATPPDLRRSGRALFASMTHFVDFLRMRWYRYVVNFGFADQYQLLTAFWQPHTWFDSGLQGLSMKKLRRWFFTKSGWWTTLGFLLFALVLGGIWVKRKRMAKSAYAKALSHEATERYRRLLSLLRKRGFQKKPGQTPDEFSQAVERNGSKLIWEFTSLYQQARFSGQTDFSDGLQKMDQILTQLGGWKHPGLR